MNELNSPKFSAKMLSVTRLGSDIYALRLSYPEPRDQGQDFDFFSGQYCRFGMEEDIDNMRPYSIASAPHRDYLEFHIRDSGQGFSKYICDENHVGTAVFLTEAAGSAFYYDDPDRDVIMFAGGTGYAPIRSILELLEDQGFDHKVSLLIGGRDVSALYMRDEMLKFQSVMPQLSVYYCADDVEGEAPLVHHGGLRSLADKHVAEALQDKRIYIAGPPPMVMDIEAYAMDNGADRALVHLDQENIELFLKHNKK